MYHLYRYRSAKQILTEYRELEKQEIYFCPTADLNDPIEGFKDLFWQGDQIVWENLLRQYILSLLHVAAPCFGGIEDCGRALLTDAVFSVPDNLSLIPLRTIYLRASQAFVDEEATTTFVSLMAVRTEPVRRNELTNYLRALHPFALNAVFREFNDHGLPIAPNFTAKVDFESLRRNAIRMMESASAMPTIEGYSEHAAEAFFAANEAAVMQLVACNN